MCVRLLFAINSRFVEISLREHRPHSSAVHSEGHRFTPSLNCIFWLPYTVDDLCFLQYSFEHKHRLPYFIHSCSDWCRSVCLVDGTAGVGNGDPLVLRSHAGVHEMVSVVSRGPHWLSPMGGQFREYRRLHWWRVGVHCGNRVSPAQVLRVGAAAASATEGAMSHRHSTPLDLPGQCCPLSSRLRPAHHHPVARLGLRLPPLSIPDLSTDCAAYV